MFRENCPECGHLLSNNRSTCPFCNWDENADQYSNSFEIENQLLYHVPEEMRPDQLPGF